MTTQNTSPSGSAITSQSLHRDHCEGTTGGTYQDVRFVVDFDLSDLASTAPVQRRAHRGQEPLTLGAQMVGIDLHAKSGHPTRAVENASDTGNRLGQGEAGPAMEVAKRLVVTRRDRHRRHHALGRKLDDLDAKRLPQAVLVQQATINRIHRQCVLARRFFIG